MTRICICRRVYINLLNIDRQNFFSLAHTCDHCETPYNVKHHIDKPPWLRTLYVEQSRGMIPSPVQCPIKPLCRFIERSWKKTEIFFFFPSKAYEFWFFSTSVFAIRLPCRQHAEHVSWDHCYSDFAARDTTGHWIKSEAIKKLIPVCATDNKSWRRAAHPW